MIFSGPRLRIVAAPRPGAPRLTFESICRVGRSDAMHSPSKGETNVSRFNRISPETATGKTKDLLDGVKSKLGRVPNMFQEMANSPAAVHAYLQFSAALAGGSLSPANREQVALAVGQLNHCDYCVSAQASWPRWLV